MLLILSKTELKFIHFILLIVLYKCGYDNVDNVIKNSLL